MCANAGGLGQTVNLESTDLAGSNPAIPTNGCLRGRLLSVWQRLVANSRPGLMQFTLPDNSRARAKRQDSPFHATYGRSIGSLPRLYRIKYSIIQAPMVGVTTPAMVAAITNVGGLGSLPVGSFSARKIVKLNRLTKKNQQVFCR